MTSNERANAIIQDILVNHLPRIKEGLEAGYVDENQILVMYDHAVRARILKEAWVEVSDADVLDAMLRDQEAERDLDRIETEIRRVVAAEGVDRLLRLAGYAKVREVRGRNKEAAVFDDANLQFKHPKERERDYEAMFGTPYVEKLACVCGGIIRDLPTSVEALLKCDQCQRVFENEFELAEVRRTEFSTPLKQPDAIYFTTGTLAGGTMLVPQFTDINLNGEKVRLEVMDGAFVLTYERIVRLALIQKGKSSSLLSDAELPNLSVTYHHRGIAQSIRERSSGTLCRGQSVSLSTGMSINAVDTSNA